LPGARSSRDSAVTDLAALTPRQIAVTALVARGLSDKAIGRTLGISHNTVRTHVAAIAKRCGCDPTLGVRVQLANWYRERVPVSLHPATGSSVRTIADSPH
jgi:DNA-binding NarL/FixJ family response regulator